MKPNARTNGDQKQKNQKERNKEMKLVGGDPRRIFLGGFSQGACIALTTYLAFKGG